MIDKDENSRISFKKLYGKVRELNKEREQEKQEKIISGIKEEGEVKESR